MGQRIAIDAAIPTLFEHAGYRRLAASNTTCKTNYHRNESPGAKRHPSDPYHPEAAKQLKLNLSD